MKNMTIGRRIFLGFGVTILVMVGLGLFSYMRVTEIQRHSKKITGESLPGVGMMGELLDMAQENFVFTLRGVLTEDLKEKQSLHSEIQTNMFQIDQLTTEYGNGSLSTEDRDLFNKVLEAKAAYTKGFLQVAELSDKGDNKGAVALIQTVLQPVYTGFEHAVEALKDFKRKDGSIAAGEIATAVSSSIRGTVTWLTGGILISVGVALWIGGSIRRILRRTSSALAEGAQQVSSASSQVASASQSLAQGASDQAASLEETSASLHEMTSMVKRNAESAQNAKSIAFATRTAADTGAGDVKELQAAMEEIKASSDDIAKIVRSIDEIAFQTNVLALNAAVEAARAGESGAGFAVVADEVRNLAQRSAMAAKETAAKIETAIGKSHRGAEVSDRVATGLESIVARIREMDLLVAGIAEASQEQSQGISQVNSALTEMDRVTQSNAAGAEQSASAAEELNSQAASVRELVLDLQALVDGARSVSTVRNQEPAGSGKGSSQGPDQPRRKSSVPAGTDRTQKTGAQEVECRGFQDF